MNATITIDTRMNPDEPEPRPPRPLLRPLVGMPIDRRRNWGSTLTSVAIHGLILLLILMPAILPEVLDYREHGAGGAGPSGGGGGGRRGTGGVLNERLNYVRPPPPPPPALAPVPTPLPPVKPPEVKKEEPKPEPPAPVATPTPPTEVASTTVGTGGGTGADGTKGTGPGTGGGIGSGVGTGTGSSNGPGTGGGIGEKYPPQVTNLAILPIPVPSRVRPYMLVAYFDVDEKGIARLIAWNPSRDDGYNKRIKEMLAEIRFRPAVLRNGTPVRDTVPIRAEAP